MTSSGLPLKSLQRDDFTNSFPHPYSLPEASLALEPPFQVVANRLHITTGIEVLLSITGFAYRTVTLGCIAHQTPLSTEFSRQKYWSGLPFPPPGDLPDPGTEPASPALQVDS